MCYRGVKVACDIGCGLWVRRREGVGRYEELGFRNGLHVCLWLYRPGPRDGVAHVLYMIEQNKRNEETEELHLRLSIVTNRPPLEDRVVWLRVRVDLNLALPKGRRGPRRIVSCWVRERTSGLWGPPRANGRGDQRRHHRHDRRPWINVSARTSGRTKRKESHSVTLRSSCMRAERLLPTNDDERTRPPRTFANVARLSRTSSIAWVHSESGLTVGSSSVRGIRRTQVKSRSKGSLGSRRISAPSGRETAPRPREIPHSRLPICVTWNAAPPTNTITTWMTISVARPEM